MKKFNTIKKSRKKSKDIDEKIEYLNSECQKTGIDEAMRTSTVYAGTDKVPNTTYSDFASLNVNGFGLGLSGGDGNGFGGAYVGTVEAGMRHASSNRIGLTGVAISPPHPVTGQKQLAMTQTGFAGFFSPLRPGVIQTSSGVPSGGVVWLYDPNYPTSGTPGLWRNLQYLSLIHI